MTTTSRAGASTSHIERTATEPRRESLHGVFLSRVEQVNDKIRLLRLAIPEDSPPVKFLSGQWVDTFVPGLPKPGGFTLTSTPADVHPSVSRFATDGDPHGYLELAVQESPKNPPAAWLWQPVTDIVGKELHVRVGGSFVWPHNPPSTHIREVKRYVFIAGGVGVNPLMSIISHLGQIQNLPYEIRFIYTVKDPRPTGKVSEILFLNRLAKLFGSGKVKGELILYLTPASTMTSQQDGSIETEEGKVRYKNRRMTNADVLDVLGPVKERGRTVCYVCGIPTMTDELVEFSQQAEGMDPHNVLFERWW
ncbi:MAG: hypothetical protein M1818_005699 [Claussenomyces sp. TS43310]|nr:MAG: hypothetical protein M1818_005699 [Claussenomyces sp. TS43310]